MKCIYITCDHANHGGIGMWDDPANDENLDYLLESFRNSGCDPIVIAYDDEKPNEIEK